MIFRPTTTKMFLGGTVVGLVAVGAVATTDVIDTTLDTTLVTEKNSIVKEIDPIDSFKVEQEKNLAKYGEYIQIKSDGTIPDGVKTDISSELIPDNVTVHVHESKNGKGYQIVTETATQTISVGYGADAKERTFVINKPINSTTSVRTR